MRLLSTLAFLLLISLGSFTGHTQTPKFHGDFDVYSTRHGLSQNDVRCLFQDSYGFIWIGTNGGLNRFDGYSFTTYQKEVSYQSISSNLISKIIEDAYGNLWIGTDDQGVMFFQRDTEKFFHIKNDKENPNLLTDNHILSMLIDQNQTIWVGTTHGLNKIRFDYKTKKAKVEHLVSSPNNPSSISHNTISGIFEDGFGNLWFGTANGLNRYINTKSGKPQFIHYNSTTSEAIREITSNDTSLLIAYTSAVLALPFREINKNNPTFRTVLNRSYSAILSDKKGNIWGINTNGAHVSYLEGGKRKTQDFTSSWSDPNSLSRNVTTAILEDRSGMIWVGTNGGGLNMYNPNKKNFEHFEKNKFENSLSYNKIRAVEEDPMGNLWIGTEGGGLNLLPHTSSKAYENGFVHFDVNPMGENYVYAIEAATFQDKTRIFIGTGHNSHLEVLDARDVAHVKRSVFNHIAFKAPVFALKQDSDGILWVGTYDNGLFRVQFDAQGEYERHSHFKYSPRDDSSLSSNIIRSIAEDRQGNIWIGTDRGINKISRTERPKASPNFIRYMHNPNDSLSLSYNYILPIFVSEAGNVWVGTLGGGLNKIIPGTTPNNDRFEWITTQNGLPNNVVKSIEEDEEGNLWIGSNGGLSKFNPKTRQIVNFGIGDGLQDLEYGEIASTARASGEMIFGGVNGFNVFYPAKISEDVSTANVVFTDLQILNRTVNTGEEVNGRIILGKNINDLSELRLKHDENSFSVSFAALHYATPKKNKYAYKLDGFDNEWIYTSEQSRIAKYTNLEPGDYTLKVKASNSDGVWNDSPITLGIVVAPPIWKTNFAMACYFILFVLALWFSRRYSIIVNTRKKHLLMEHLEKEKTEELSQLKLQFFTNISHEFRTPLTLILGLIERLKNTPNAFRDDDRVVYYEKIYRNSQVLLNLVNQLLDFRKIEQGKTKVRVAYGDIGEYTKGLCENFNELARRNSIDFNFICETELKGYYDRDIIERIVFNLLSNAFKFTNHEGEITTSLEKDKTPGFLRLEVSDTGMGMDPDVQAHLFERFSHTHVKREQGSGIGLAFIKSLIELYHGTITFDSKPNIGTTFRVTFPYTREAFKNDILLGEETGQADTKKEMDWILDLDQSMAKSETAATGNKEHNILLVEDNEDILFYLSEHFKNAYNIYIAHEGKEALEICLREHIDLVVSDVMMPEMDGLEFCEALKSDDRINHIPIILLTAKKSPDNKVKGYEKGADAYIAKPFNMVELETRMEALIASRKNILAKLRKNISLEPSEIEITSLDEKFLKRVISYIEENIGLTEFTVEMLAKECGMSQLHLNKKLKVLVGQTANAFVRSIRLKRAAQLLAKNRYSVNEVMYEVGFMDAKYFRTCFKKEFGTPPSEYQKNAVDESEHTDLPEAEKV
ncbi:response regulator [Pontibacter sp. E15-1]|uniref:hybrid sensor histidine kinase/response regulator transcription factor n=1 Tax=Pontibacter sp. E15-1 TaxID=2919918 RepID=UPI001F5016F9|nr:two-component regulator propeller domain-containing protein [Pontibacter sp. E15-1]MCJ8163285.1 response regulator [Pontibacter sp. E15-1]